MFFFLEPANIEIRFTFWLYLCLVGQVNMPVCVVNLFLVDNWRAIGLPEAV